MLRSEYYFVYLVSFGLSLANSLCRYTDAANLKEHASSPAFKQFGKALAGNLAAAPEIKRADFIAGFEGRSKL